MDTRNSKTNRRNWLVFLLAPIALFLAGCDVKLTDLTPPTMKANPSNTYTITARVNVKNSAVIDGSVQPEVIIDGKAHPMNPAPGGNSLYEFDYNMPPGRDAAAYYILVRYQRKTASASVSKEIYSGIKEFQVQNRYSVELEVNRAPVGSRVAILGRGFNREDKVMVGGVPAVSQVESPTSLAFFVPSLPEGRSYNVTVLGATGELAAGSIRVDASSIRVSPGSLDLRSGQSRPLVFSISTPAPPGGLLVNVTTDVPDSVIMPEVIVPAGERSTSVNVEGGEPGSGNLYVEVDGYSDITVPITVE